MHAKIVLASNNSGKLQELTSILAPLDFSLLPQTAFDFPAHEETGLSFVENAISKARWASKYTSLPAIGDDSGLVVDALSGAPGIYSSRYAGLDASDEENMHKLLDTMAHITHRTAHFYCAMVFVKHHTDPTPLIATGRLNGEILSEKRGEHGFGYDPIFYVPTHHKSAAEISKDDKNTISHRAKACASLTKQLRLLS